MKEYETDLKGNKLVREEEINLIYEGPSFEGKMEISNLVSQLRSTEFVIKDLVSEAYKQKGIKKPEETKIYLRLKKGSFHEIISVVFNNPTTAHIIGGCIVALFTYFLTKKNGSECNIKIENLTKNYTFTKNLNQIIAPLEDKKDTIKIVSSNPKINKKISLPEKKIMNKILKKLKESLAFEIVEEEFFGYLSMLDLDKGKYAFTLEGTDKHTPVVFDDKPSLREIKKILGHRLKINARATYEEKELKKLDISEYEIKRRKNLKDFSK
jgi:hypothetical protein